MLGIYVSDLNADYIDMPFGRGGPATPGIPGSNSRTKRMRTSFKHHQLRTMKSYFAINHNPDAKDLKQLSQKTGLPKRVLQVSDCDSFICRRISSVPPFLSPRTLHAADVMCKVWRILIWYKYLKVCLYIRYRLVVIYIKRRKKKMGWKFALFLRIFTLSIEEFFAPIIESSKFLNNNNTDRRKNERIKEGSIEMARKGKSKRSIVSSRSGRKIQEAWNRPDAQLKRNLQGRLAVKVFAAGCAQASSN